MKVSFVYRCLGITIFFYISPISGFYDRSYLQYRKYGLNFRSGSCLFCPPKVVPNQLMIDRSRNALLLPDYYRFRVYDRDNDILDLNTDIEDADVSWYNTLYSGKTSDKNKIDKGKEFHSKHDYDKQDKHHKDYDDKHDKHFGEDDDKHNKHSKDDDDKHDKHSKEDDDKHDKHSKEDDDKLEDDDDSDKKRKFHPKFDLNKHDKHGDDADDADDADDGDKDKKKKLDSRKDLDKPDKNSDNDDDDKDDKDILNLGKVLGDGEKEKKMKPEIPLKEKTDENLNPNQSIPPAMSGGLPEQMNPANTQLNLPNSGPSPVSPNIASTDESHLQSNINPNVPPGAPGGLPNLGANNFQPGAGNFRPNPWNIQQGGPNGFGGNRQRNWRFGSPPNQGQIFQNA